MKDIFEKMAHDPSVTENMKANPITEALFFAFYDYVKDGNELSDIPWFAITKYAKRKKMA